MASWDSVYDCCHIEREPVARGTSTDQQLTRRCSAWPSIHARMHGLHSRGSPRPFSDKVILQIVSEVAYGVISRTEELMISAVARDHPASLWKRVGAVRE
jgi:hypothetical protein